MALPLFHPTEDPGPDFSSLLQRTGLPVASGSAAAASAASASGASGAAGASQGGDFASSVRHATTVVALRFAEGVILAGDRRATEGHAIAHRAMEKVFPADRYSAVAIAGAAGFAVEMVRLFQTQLEHYEKVEGVTLSLEGKANQLAQMVRQHLPLAFQGLAVVPLFAGYDTARGTGRIFTYDVTGGHYEEADFQATGPGGRDARTTIKLGFREGLSRNEGVELAIQALYEAADEDSGTGGPDVVRGIYPTIAVVTVDGYQEVPEDEVAARFQALIERKRSEREATVGSSGGGEPT